MRHASAVLRRSLLLAAVVTSVSAQCLTAEVWRCPQCGCCGGWIDHLRAEGFMVTDRVVPSVAPFRRMLGTPAELSSSHAVRIAGMALEGHVPAHAIRAALGEGLARIAGVAVPAMPIESPGMEVPGREAEPYDVIAWRPDGTQFVLPRMRGTAPA